MSSESVRPLNPVPEEFAGNSLKQRLKRCIPCHAPEILSGIRLAGRGWHGLGRIGVRWF